VPKTLAEWPALLDSRPVWCQTLGMDSLQDILGGRTYEAPDEVQAIKDYIKRRYKSSCKIKLERDTIVLSVPNSTLAATVQLERQSLINSCNITKKLFIRYGR
jgi:hypothetical protein